MWPLTSLNRKAPSGQLSPSGNASYATSEQHFNQKLYMLDTFQSFRLVFYCSYVIYHSKVIAQENDRYQIPGLYSPPAVISDIYPMIMILRSSLTMSNAGQVRPRDRKTCGIPLGSSMLKPIRSTNPDEGYG